MAAEAGLEAQRPAPGCPCRAASVATAPRRWTASCCCRGDPRALVLPGLGWRRAESVCRQAVVASGGGSGSLIFGSSGGGGCAQLDFDLGLHEARHLRRDVVVDAQVEGDVERQGAGKHDPLEPPTRSACAGSSEMAKKDGCVLSRAGELSGPESPPTPSLASSASYSVMESFLVARRLRADLNQPR